VAPSPPGKENIPIRREVQDFFAWIEIKDYNPDNAEMRIWRLQGLEKKERQKVSTLRIELHSGAGL
jgi:hypothetical protein